MDLLTALGVKYSKLKTYKSRKMCEFAKRYHYGRHEFSPFPLSSVVDQARSVPLVVAALIGEERKGLVSVNGIPAAVGDLDSTRRKALGLPQRKDNRPKRAALCELATRILTRRADTEAVASMTQQLLSHFGEFEGREDLWSAEVAPRI